MNESSSLAPLVAEIWGLFGKESLSLGSGVVAMHRLKDILFQRNMDAVPTFILMQNAQNGSKNERTL